MCITIRNLSKSYNSKPGRNATGLFAVHKQDYALQNINLNINQGECVGIIGKNGSGKSTLLKLICGVTSSTEGSISVNGKISALLELGAGFNPEYTGISNIYLNGAIQGLTKKEIKSLLPEIEAFADIGEHIKKPVKTYSDGIFLRLAFACAVAIKPDILIIDEALAVGDFAFRQKCFSKIKSMKDNGVTIIMVSHDIDAIRRLCERTVWLENGSIIQDGHTASVSAAYMQSMTGCAGTQVLDLKASAYPADECFNRFGSAIGSIMSVKAPSVQQTGNLCEIICTVSIPSNAKLKDLALSISFKNSFGLDLSVISSADCGITFSCYGTASVRIAHICYLCPGEYSLCVSLEDRGSNPIKYYDYADGITTFRVISNKEYFGVFHTPAEMSIDE